MLWDKDLISFSCMWISGFPNTIYRRDSSFPIVFPWHLCRKLVNSVCSSSFLSTTHFVHQSFLNILSVQGTAQGPQMLQSRMNGHIHRTFHTCQAPILQMVKLRLRLVRSSAQGHRMTNSWIESLIQVNPFCFIFLPRNRAPLLPSKNS